jgi:hypothetical protein
MATMDEYQPRLYLNTYAPLVSTRQGCEASEAFNLPPFIDGSIRREPDFENQYPSISCLCRGPNFAPRLRVGDVVVYLAKKGKYQSQIPHRRLSAVLRVIHVFDNHGAAATWYRAQGLPLPSNCMVGGNPPNPLDHSHRHNEYSRLPEAQFHHNWDMGYHARARKFPTFVVCEAIRRDLGWNAKEVHDADLLAVFGRVPATRNPGRLNISHWKDLMRQLGVSIPPSAL